MSVKEGREESRRDTKHWWKSGTRKGKGRKSDYKTFRIHFSSGKCFAGPMGSHEVKATL